MDTERLLLIFLHIFSIKEKNNFAHKYKDILNNGKNLKKLIKKIAKDIKDAWDEAANYDKKVHGPKVETTKPTSTPSSPGKKYNVKLPKKTEEKTTTTTKTEVVYQEGSIGKLEKQIQDLQEKLKSATTGQLRKNIQGGVQTVRHGGMEEQV